MLYEELTQIIIGAFYEVYNTLGYGFLENVYQNAMYKELLDRGLKCEPQKRIDVYYKGERVGVYYADILVEESIILELKSANDISDAHKAQLTNYLKATKIQIGLLLNFGTEPQFSRKIYNYNGAIVTKGSFEDK